MKKIINYHYLKYLVSTQNLPKKMPKITSFSFRNKRQKLVFIGLQHTNNSKNEYYKKIEQKFKYLVRKNPDHLLVIHEVPITVIYQEKSQMVSHYGESGLLVFLARKFGIPYECQNPDTEKLLQFIINKKQFSAIDVALWIFINTLVWLVGKNKRMTAKDVVQLKKLLIELRKLFGIKLSILILSKRLQNIFKKKIIPNSFADFKKEIFQIKKIRAIQDPFKNNSVVNNVGAAINYARDYYIARAILKRLSQGKSVFTVFGINHAIAQNLVFKEYFKQKI